MTKEELTPLITSSTNVVDILLITATKDERDVVLSSEDDWEEKADDSGFTYHVRRDHAGLRWALSRAMDMGPEYAANVATRLVSSFKPRCLAMVGVCAGWREKVQLGDVIVADRLFRYDNGKLRAFREGGALKEEVFHDIHTYNLKAKWRHIAEDFPTDWITQISKNTRPLGYENQEVWLLFELNEVEKNPGAGATLMESPARKQNCPDWTNVIARLENRRMLTLKGGLHLTNIGRSYVQELRERYPDGYPSERTIPKVLVAPMATGNLVVEDDGLFPTIHKYIRKTLAVDMEGSAVAAVAEIENIEHCLVVKGVQDYASTDKDDRFREYAIEAAYRFLAAYLQNHLEPVKRHLPLDEVVPTDLTRIEDILNIIYHKRKVIVDPVQGTDSSSGKRIKFALWEVWTPKSEYILVLYPNINLPQTINRCAFLAQQQNLIIKSLTILRIDERESSKLTISEIENNFPKVYLSQFTLKEFIRDYCIDSDLTKPRDVWEEPFFVDQTIYKMEEDGLLKKQDEQAIPFLLKLIKSPTCFAAHLILADGGDGKSSLCSSLVNAINDPARNFGKNAILLRIDEIRQKINSDVANNFRISSVYDIYDLFVIIANPGGEKVYYPKISKTEFEVSVFCGNLVVVIDGLDELFSVFQDRFDKTSFLASILALNSQLGESSVILTSRGNLLADVPHHEHGLAVYFLKGFAENESNQYFRKRFAKQYNNKDKIINQCNRNVNSLMESAKTDRISPFIVDLIANINTTEQNDDNDNDVDYSLVGKNYPSNSDLTDKVVFNVLRRELERQKIQILTTDLVDLFCEIASEHGSSIDLEALRNIINEYYGEQANSIYESLLVNPLVKKQPPTLTYRYHFLYNYFLTLFILKGILNPSYVANPNYYSTFSKFAEGSLTTSYQDILKFARDHAKDINFEEIIFKLRTAYESSHLKQISRAISFFVHLLIDVQGQGISKKDLSELVLSLFNYGTQQRKIRYLFIFGETTSLDFSGYTVTNSGFFGYKSFLKSNLEGANFSTTNIDIEVPESAELAITRETFDTTCCIGNLSKYLRDHGNIQRIPPTNKQVILKRLFREFLKNNAFIERQINELRFPDDLDGGIPKYFREAKSQDVLYTTEDGKKCGVTRSERKKVSDFLTNSTLDKKILKILAAID